MRCGHFDDKFGGVDDVELLISQAHRLGDGQPSLSFRGSAHAFSDTQLAIWVRNPDGGLLKALGANNRITAMYRDPETRASMQFRGKAHLEDSEAGREALTHYRVLERFRAHTYCEVELETELRVRTQELKRIFVEKYIENPNNLPH